MKEPLYTHLGKTEPESLVVLLTINAILTAGLYEGWKRYSNPFE